MLLLQKQQKNYIKSKFKKHHKNGHFVGSISTCFNNTKIIFQHNKNAKKQNLFMKIRQNEIENSLTELAIAITLM